MQQPYSRLLDQLRKEAEIASQQARVILKEVREGTSPQPVTIVNGNHMQIMYENQKLASDFLSAGSQPENWQLELAE